MLELITALLILFLLTKPIILIPTITVIILIYYLKIRKYNNSSYYKITKASYFGIKFDKGKYGEYLIYKYLMGLEQQGAKFLFNIYVPKNDEETTEIDVLMISRKGLFVFESKTIVAGSLAVNFKNTGIKPFLQEEETEVIKKNFIIPYTKIILILNI